MEDADKLKLQQAVQAQMRQNARMAKLLFGSLAVIGGACAYMAVGAVRNVREAPDPYAAQPVAGGSARAAPKPLFNTPAGAAPAPGSHSEKAQSFLKRGG